MPYIEQFENQKVNINDEASEVLRNEAMALRNQPPGAAPGRPSDPTDSPNQERNLPELEIIGGDSFGDAAPEIQQAKKDDALKSKDADGSDATWY